MAKKMLGVRLDEDFIKEIKKHCIEKDVPMQDAVKIAMKDWMVKTSDVFSKVEQQ